MTARNIKTVSLKWKPQQLETGNTELQTTVFHEKKTGGKGLQVTMDTPVGD